ncbi:hypothetical protein EMPS_11523 [Entomortierella parvispora]|uniref:Uncharacterized protein n=1 Tax=Entomortierella parvispora TaxID=205924 RepID=A0A9P3M284_9FUNG|nr:hypothetical protein EMPS_11523 [Entomortierella parvispora]
MKFVLRPYVAALLAYSVLADQGLKDFVNDPQVQALAPNLVRQISSRGIETLASQEVPNEAPTNQLPLLNDIVEIISLTVFSAKDADWSKLEQAKLKMIETHGEALAEASADLTTVDTHRAALIANTIYDTVIHIPSTNKATYTARVAASKSWSIWDYIGFGLIKSSDAVRNVKALVAPVGVCETTDTAYLKGVEEAVYYSSLTDGLAGSALVGAPSNSTVKKLGLGTIIASIGQLAIQIHMAQSVARLSDLDPRDESVKAMILLALTADTPKADAAKAARDVYSIKRRGIEKQIPSQALHSLEDQAALILVTRGAGRGAGQTVFANIPVIRNLFAFSSEVLTANNVGDVLKYVFCPSEAITDVPIVESPSPAPVADSTPEAPMPEASVPETSTEPKTETQRKVEETKKEETAAADNNKPAENKKPETADTEEDDDDDDDYEIDIKEINEAEDEEGTVMAPQSNEQPTEQPQPPAEQEKKPDEQQQKVFKVDSEDDKKSKQSEDDKKSKKSKDASIRAKELADKVASDAKTREEEFQKAAEAAAHASSDDEGKTDNNEKKQEL